MSTMDEISKSKVVVYFKPREGFVLSVFYSALHLCESRQHMVDIYHWDYFFAIHGRETQFNIKAQHHDI